MKGGQTKAYWHPYGSSVIPLMPVGLVINDEPAEPAVEPTVELEGPPEPALSDDR